MALPDSPDFEVDVHKAKEMIDNNEVRVVDVRTQFQAPAMLGADYVPLDEILAQPATAIPTGKPVLFICNIGQTSSVATQMAKAMNVVDAYNMQGGMTAWAEAGYDTEDPPAGH
jgi:hydroxyacylglutathione hydrolase